MTTQKDASPQVALQAHPFHLEGRSCLSWAGLGGLSVSLPAPSAQAPFFGTEICQSPSPMRLCALNMSPGGKGHSTQKHEWGTRHSRDTSRSPCSGCGHHSPSGGLSWNRCSRDLKGTWFLVEEEQPSVPRKEPEKQEVHICNPSF